MRNVTCVLLLAAVVLGITGCQTQENREAAIHAYVQAQLLVEKGNLDDALAELTRALEADPTLAVAHAAKGDIHRKKGDYKLAAESYQSACELNPYSFRPHYNLGVTYQRLAAAARDYKQTETYLGDAVRVYLRATTIQPDDFDANLNLSACYFQLGQYSKAELYCKSAIALQPKSAQAYSNLGIIYDSQNRLYDAIRAYKTSLELDTNQPNVMLNLGSTYLRQNRVKQALAVFEIATQRKNDFAAAYEQIGVCYVHLRDFPKALTAYRKAVQLDPKSAPAYRGLGVVLMSTWLRDRSNTTLRDEALEAWNRSLELNPNQPKLKELVQKYTPELAPPEL